MKDENDNKEWKKQQRVKGGENLQIAEYKDITQRERGKGEREWEGGRTVNTFKHSDIQTKKNYVNKKDDETMAKKIGVKA